MKLSQYQELALRTEKPLPTQVERLVHACLGVITEGGEMATEVKRMSIYGKGLQDVVVVDGKETTRVKHIAEEIGDVMWYLAIAADAVGINLEQIAIANIAKLRARFPDAYSNEAASARADKPEEDRK